MLHSYLPYPLITIDDVVSKNQQFVCEFIELKRNGFHHFTRALNDLTYHFWSPWLHQADKNIDQLAENMKSAVKVKL